MTADMEPVKEAASTRERMVTGTAELLSRAGIAEASLRNVVALTGAPRGSIYHHFPGGKSELVAEAMSHVGGRLLAGLHRTPVGSPDDVVVVFAGLFRHLAEAQRGCPVGAVAASPEGDAPALAAAARVFAAWRSKLEEMFDAAGASDRATGLAALTLATVEGALALARASDTIEVFDDAVDELVRVVGAGG